MTLKDCTREELLKILARLKLSAPVAFQIDLILADLEFDRNERKYNKANAYLKTIREKSQAYIELVSPYEGKPLMDIPQSVFNKGAQLLQEKKAAEREWAKLMGIKLPEPRKELATAISPTMISTRRPLDEEEE